MIADEAHRWQYDFIDGIARHMRGALPAAWFAGFDAPSLHTMYVDKPMRGHGRM